MIFQGACQSGYFSPSRFLYFFTLFAIVSHKDGHPLFKASFQMMETR